MKGIEIKSFGNTWDGRKAPVLDNHKRGRGTAVAHRFRSKDYRNLRTGQRRQDGRRGAGL